MKKFIASLSLMILLGYSVGLFLPWWSIAIACFLVSALIAQKRWLSFITGFLSQMLLWGGLSLIISIRNEHILAHKISKLIIHQDNPALLILITSLIAAVTGGMASWSGSFLHKTEKIKSK